MRSMKASELKAKLLAVLDEVEKTGEPINITKRGRPVATLVSSIRGASAHPQDSLRGSVEIVGDIVSPVLSPADWDVERGGR